MMFCYVWYSVGWIKLFIVVLMIVKFLCLVCLRNFILVINIFVLVVIVCFGLKISFKLWWCFRWFSNVLVYFEGCGGSLL